MMGGELTCRATGDLCYTTEEAVTRSRNDVLATPYQCKSCGMWHVDRVLLGVPRGTEVL